MTTTPASVMAPLILLGASDVDACSGDSCVIRADTTTAL
jgi:hypothetical protein